jgi:hypothetical protein
MKRSVDLTADASKRGHRALVAADASVQAGAFDAALVMLATAEAAQLDGLQRARVDLAPRRSHSRRLRARRATDADDGRSRAGDIRPRSRTRDLPHGVGRRRDGRPDGGPQHTRRDFPARTMSPVPLPRSSIARMTALLCSMSIPKLGPATTRAATNGECPLRFVQAPIRRSGTAWLRAGAARSGLWEVRRAVVHGAGLGVVVVLSLPARSIRVSAVSWLCWP